MPGANFQIVIDCANPDAQARFWSVALGYDLQEPPEPHATWREYWTSLGVPEGELEAADGYDAVVDPVGVLPRIWFQKVPEGKSVKNRLHFDLLVGGGRGIPLDERRTRVDAEVERLRRLGSTVRRVMDEPDQGQYAVGMSDPEGNEFDVV